jgi:DinB superfamily
VVPQLGGFMAQTSGEVLSEERGWLMQRIELDEAKTFLRRTPQVLDALLRGLPEAWVHENEGPDTWSSFDVVGHLIEAEETNWILRVRHLIEHGEASAFPPFDCIGFVEKSKGKNMAEVLDACPPAAPR